MALWGGRFEAGVAEVTQEFGASLPADKHLYKQDTEVLTTINMTRNMEFNCI